MAFIYFRLIFLELKMTTVNGIVNDVGTFLMHELLHN